MMMQHYWNGRSNFGRISVVETRSRYRVALRGSANAITPIRARWANRHADGRTNAQLSGEYDELVFILRGRLTRRINHTSVL